MSPWMSAMKATPCVTHASHAAPAGLPARALPSCPGIVNFGRLQLAKSMARCNALATAKPKLLRSLAAAAVSHLDEFVEDPPPGLEILTSANDLADMQLVKFAHDLGVGLADLYMEALGFAWRDNGKTVLSGSGPVPDFVYDDGSGATGVVAVEAKGSASPRANATAINTTALQGYRNQVEPSLGKALAGGSSAAVTIEAGYAIGAAAPAGGAAAVLVVHQTSFPAQASSGPSAGPRVNTSVALGNYRAAFALAGADGLVAAIDAQRRFERPPVGSVDPSHWTLISTYRGRQLFVHEGGALMADLTGIRFAMDGEVLAMLLNILQSPRAMAEPFILIPPLPEEALSGGDEGFALSRDGFCAVLADVAKPRGVPDYDFGRFGGDLKPERAMEGVFQTSVAQPQTAVEV